MDDRTASSTAVLVCQGRAVAHGRIAVGRFDDPMAMALLRDAEREVVERVRTGVPPKGFGERLEYEMVRSCAEVMAPRTVAIDDAVRDHPAPQLVILGAGLDGRAWRMPELSSTDVFEVDHPASQRDKRDRAGPLQPLAGSLRFVPVDFTADNLGTALGAAGHRESVPTTWIWEGVVPYLAKAEVEETLRIVSGRSAPGSRLVVNYQAPNLAATVGRLAARAIAAAGRRSDPLSREPRRSAWTPDTMRKLLERHRWDVADDRDLLSLSDGLSISVENRRSLPSGRVTVADR